MPYRKKGYYDRRGRRKSNIFYRRARNKSYYMAKKALQMLNVEVKHHDINTNTGVNTTASIIQISNIAQGDTSETRDGNQIKCTELVIDMCLYIHGSATATVARIMLIKDKQTNGAIYSASDLLNDTTAQGQLISPVNLDNKFRFVVMKDMKINLSANKTSQCLSWRIPQQVKLRYGSNNGNITDLQSNSYSILVASNEATNAPTLYYAARLRYVDN